MKKEKKDIGNKEAVELIPLKKVRMIVKIKGVTSLLMEKMDNAVVEMYDKKKGRKMIQKDTRLEIEKVDGKIHHTEDGNVGFPVAGFLKGMDSVARDRNEIVPISGKQLRGSVRILGNIIPIDYKEQKINEAWGKSSGATGAPRKICRPEFTDWSCDLEILYSQNTISPEEIINTLNWAGFYMGLGAWRPEKGGSYGQYELVLGD